MRTRVVRTFLEHGSVVFEAERKSALCTTHCTDSCISRLSGDHAKRVSCNEAERTALKLNPQTSIHAPRELDPRAHAHACTHITTRTSSFRLCTRSACSLWMQRGHAISWRHSRRGKKRSPSCRLEQFFTSSIASSVPSRRRFRPPIVLSSTNDW